MDKGSISSNARFNFSESGIPGPRCRRSDHAQPVSENYCRKSICATFAFWLPELLDAGTFPQVSGLLWVSARFLSTGTAGRFASVRPPRSASSHLADLRKLALCLNGDPWGDYQWRSSGLGRY